MQARVLRVGETSMGAAVARAALEGARRSRDVEAGGVTRDSNAHLTASLRLSTHGRARRVALKVSGLAAKVSTGNAGTTRPGPRIANRGGPLRNSLLRSPMERVTG